MRAHPRARHHPDQVREAMATHETRCSPSAAWPPHRPRYQHPHPVCELQRRVSGGGLHGLLRLVEAYRDAFGTRAGRPGGQALLHPISLMRWSRPSARRSGLSGRRGPRRGVQQPQRAAPGGGHCPGHAAVLPSWRRGENPLRPQRRLAGRHHWSAATLEGRARDGPGSRPRTAGDARLPQEMGRFS